MRLFCFILFFALLSIGSVNAYSIQYQLTDINGGSPIENVIITVVGNESQTLNNTLTDASGFASIEINETLTYYTHTFENIQYHTSIQNYTTETVINKVLTPISDDGISRITFNDKMSSREFCIYFKANMRLKECYQVNDTVQLLVNQEYIMIPKTNTIDLISSPNNLKENLGVYAGLIVIFIMFVIFAYLIYKLIKRLSK